MQYWKNLDLEIQEYCKQTNLKYVINDDSVISEFNKPPVVVNFFIMKKLKSLLTDKQKFLTCFQAFSSKLKAFKL